MAKPITLKFPARCADRACGAELPAGASARWYGRGRVYGIGCHEKAATSPADAEEGPPVARGVLEEAAPQMAD